MPRDAVSRTAHVGTVGTNSPTLFFDILHCTITNYTTIIYEDIFTGFKLNGEAREGEWEGDGGGRRAHLQLDHTPEGKMLLPQ